MQFTLEKTDNQTSARAGEMITDHGRISTPVFMPVGTLGSVKGIHAPDLENEVNASIILGNTYHLFLRPGLDVLRQAGGLHAFSGWKRPILTDSGGFQVFSLSDNRKLSHEGAEFRSHIDGSKHFFSPENVVDIQRIIGADVIMAFDECPPGDSDRKYAKKSMELTHQWLKRGVERFDETPPLYGYDQVFFPIVQGGSYADMRRESAEY
ncbi:MAG: tRNA guanosine(34) transglycosylase Tgt, partial [Marinilabiliaceae bacterium]